ncbi:MAG TPA: DUF427 domain-containing protein [Vicinamibacterales bacterium]
MKSPFASIDEEQPADLRPGVEPTARWVRVRFAGQVIADTRRALLLRQYGREQLPSYYFPQEDVRMDALVTGADAGADDAVSWRSVQIGGRVAPNAAWIVHRPPPALAPLSGYVSFAWGKMDGWYEEEEEVFVHARDPHTRVDVLPSSRHVRVVIDGVVVAESRRPRLLFETALPTRYYIPREDVRMELLEPTGLKTRCPYKGLASYWNLRVGGRVAQNIVWSYPDPIDECPKIRGLLSFFNERVDLYVDGELQARPATAWS